jgi:hypothetical protein
MEQNKDIIKEMEELYPETTGEFKRIMQAQYEIFCRKQSNYGPDAIALGKDITLPKADNDRKTSLIGVWFRMNDKVNRLKQMLLFNQSDMVGEPIDDSFSDLSVYGIIAQIVKNGKWGK